jgi:2-iminobutanoate/2-iminopropanoate deaminase
MTQRPINPTGMSYSLACEITNPTRFVFVSGQVPEDEAGNVPGNFRSQCLLVWKNIELQLKAAGMNLNNIIKVTVFLSDRKYRKENSEIRQEILGPHQPALTVIIAGIYEERWLLEIEVIAAN